MTATQVFLRFIKSEYTNKDGTYNLAKLKLWRNELRNNKLSTRLVDFKPRRTVRRSKNYVDDFLSENNYTLSGFMTHFLYYRHNYRLRYVYGYIVKELEKNITDKWRAFLNQHIEGDLKGRWGYDSRKPYKVYKWKD